MMIMSELLENQKRVGEIESAKLLKDFKFKYCK